MNRRRALILFAGLAGAACVVASLCRRGGDAPATPPSPRASLEEERCVRRSAALEAEARDADAAGDRLRAARARSLAQRLRPPAKEELPADPLEEEIRRHREAGNEAQARASLLQAAGEEER